MIKLSHDFIRRKAFFTETAMINIRKRRKPRNWAKFAIIARIIAALTFAVIVLPLPLSGFAQESGLGYSEGPYPLQEAVAEAPTIATGPTALAAIQASAASGVEISLKAIHVESYQGIQFANVAIGLNINTEEGSAIARQRRGSNYWEFLCRRADPIHPIYMVSDCQVPEAITQRLAAGLEAAYDAQR